MILETERLMQKTCGLRGCGARITTATLNQSAQEKNGFAVLSEDDRGGRTVLTAEKKL